MANPKSYAWASSLQAAVAVGADAVVNTPGIEVPANYDTANAEAVHNGQVLTKDTGPVSWEDDWSHAHVTNNTEADWLAGDTIYLALAGVPFDPSNVEESFTALDARVSKNEADIAALTTRIAALETRVAALETPMTLGTQASQAQRAQ